MPSKLELSVETKKKKKNQLRYTLPPCPPYLPSSMISLYLSRLLFLGGGQLAIVLTLPNYPSRLLHRNNHNRNICYSTSNTFNDSYNPEVAEVAKEKPSSAHVPVLLNEVVAQFNDRCLSSFVDCTLGAGGHASAIIKSHSELQTFIGFDVDPKAHLEARSRIDLALGYANHSSTTSQKLQLHLLRSNFKHIKDALKQVDNHIGLSGVNGILMDLGVSSMQMDSPERGFSFQHQGPVDMRMDPSQILKAEEILNYWPEVEIARILHDYGEERRWKYLARKIVDARLSGGIQSTSRLVEVVGGRLQNFGKGRMHKHPATRTFQALRIAVNDELSSLETALVDAAACLAPKGRLAIISFHSLEDRLVKHAFLKLSDPKATSHDLSLETKYSKDTSFKKNKVKVSVASGKMDTCKQFAILTRKPIVPSFEESARNPRCRSAKMRVIERL